MSLINCKECNNNISTKADHCPKCGATVNNFNKGIYIVIIISVFWVLITLILPYYYLSTLIESILKEPIDYFGFMQNSELISSNGRSRSTDLPPTNEYIHNIKLYDLKAKYYSTYLEGSLPGVTFKLKNTGNKSLKEVEVVVYFKDSKGNIIAEENYYPVLVTPFSIDNSPLKPNYIWQMERGKFYKASSVPDEWKEGSISAKIVNIKILE